MKVPLVDGLVWMGTAMAAAPDIELTGVMGAGKEVQVALKTKDGASRWVLIGKQFIGYTVESHDPKSKNPRGICQTNHAPFDVLW